MPATKRKTKTSAKTARVHATRSNYRPSTTKPQGNWAQQEQPAQLYTMPFNPEHMQQATEQASAQAQQAWQGMQDYFKPERLQEQFTSFYARFNSGEAQSQFQEFGRGSAEQFNRSATQMAEVLHELYEISRENTAVLTEAGNRVVSVTKDMGAEIITYANRGFAQNVELSKQVMSCRTLNDLFDWAGKLFKANLDGYFTQSVQLSEMLFEAANEISDPINQCVSETTERLSRTLKA